MTHENVNSRLGVSMGDISSTESESVQVSIIPMRLVRLFQNDNRWDNIEGK